MGKFHVYIAMALAFVCAAAAWGSLVWQQASGPTESSRWTYESYRKKNAYAADVSLQGRKLVLIAGSSGLFGVNMQTIEAQTGTPAVNFGVHAGLRLPYMLEQARKVLQAGDIAIIAVEYELFMPEPIPNEVLVDYVFARDPAYLSRQDLLDRIRFFGAISAKRLQEGWAAKQQPPAALPSGYQSVTLNRNGDETKKVLDPNQPGLLANHAAALKEVPAWSAMLKGIPADSPRWSLFREFVEWCHERRIRVLVTYPGLAYFTAYETPLAQATLRQMAEYYQTLGVPVLGAPRDFFYDRRYLYDSIYHLNAEGARLHTEKMLTALQPYLD